MRVLYFSRDYTPHDHRFLAALAETKHEVFFLRLERGHRQVEDRPVPSRITQVHWQGGTKPFKKRYLPGYLLSLRRVVRHIKPDLMHAGPIQDVGLLAALSGFRPLLIMSWGFDLMQDAERDTASRWITRFVLRNATFFTSDCEATRSKAVAYGVPLQRTVVFPWGVDLTHFSLPKDKRSAKRQFVLLCNRSWEPRYGVDVLARAFVKVCSQRRDVLLLLLGGGSQALYIRQIIENGAAGPFVNCVGQVAYKDLKNWYHKADLFISPSHVDGSSVSLLEAMACGLPVLVSDIPANREWVTDNVNGWLFPDGNSDVLADKIMAAMVKRALLSKLGHAAHAVARKRADWRENFQQLLSAYQSAVDLEGVMKKV